MAVATDEQNQLGVRDSESNVINRKTCRRTWSTGSLWSHLQNNMEMYLFLGVSVRVQRWWNDLIVVVNDIDNSISNSMLNIIVCGVDFETCQYNLIQWLVKTLSARYKHEQPYFCGMTEENVYNVYVQTIFIHSAKQRYTT